VNLVNLAQTSWSFDLPENAVVPQTLFAEASGFMTSNLAGCLETYEIVMSDASPPPAELTISSDGLLKLDVGSAVKDYSFGIKVSSERSTGTGDDSGTV
jgi:hypothetical protein